jgi:hypothetical protein
MSTGEKVVILITAICVTAVLAATTTALIRNIRARRRANRVNRQINKLR